MCHKICKKKYTWVCISLYRVSKCNCIIKTKTRRVYFVFVGLSVIKYDLIDSSVGFKV